MFTMRLRDPFGSHGVSCVKLPAAVAFPTDDRLLQRIEELRRALPANNMKPLWKSRERASGPAPSEAHAVDVEAQPTIKVSLGAPSPEPHTCVVPLARAAGSLPRGHERLSRALHGSAIAS
jgi:hypothetical protein